MDGHIEITTTLDAFGLVVADASATGIDALRAALGADRVRLARTDLRLALDNSTETIGADALDAAGSTGTGRTVAVIDSGVAAGHPALADSIVAQGCFLQGTPEPAVGPGVGAVEMCANGTTSGPSATPCTLIAIACSHGTAVAGVITGNGPTNRGVAPETGIIALRVSAILKGVVQADHPDYPYSPYIPEAGVLAALEHVYSLRNSFDIAAVNLSLGGSPGLCVDAAWEDIVQRLSDVGIAVVAASGNQGWDDAITFPACLDGVISVGSTDPDGSVSVFTNSSADLDLLAPGGSIATTVTDAVDGSGYAVFDGTSFSAPHVAAGLALLDDPGPGWTVDRARNLLRVTGDWTVRATSSPFDRDPQFPDIRLDAAAEFAPFSDAGAGFWVRASDWAKATGVSGGLGDGSFGPTPILTRAQAVILLWRFMGSPEVGDISSFGDVGPEDWFAPAVAWAAAAGVTTGTAPGQFSPGDAVTRAQLVAFMWRTAGSPTANVAAGFGDVDPFAYYADAVDWMAEHGITTGTTALTFSPDDPITRGQMITFEFRLADADLAWTGPVAPPDLALF